jgi:hypothetical protein
MFKGDFECPSCGNDLLFYLDREYKTKIVETPIKAVNVHMKGFHVSKERYRMVFHKDDTISVNFLGKNELKYHLVEKSVLMKKFDEEEEFVPHYTYINKFFKDMSLSNILDIISNDVNRKLYNFVYQNLYSRGRGWSYDRSIGYGLTSLLDKPFLETLYFGGFTTDYVLKNLLDYEYQLNKKETKLHLMLGVPKMFVPILKGLNSYSAYAIRDMNKLYETINGNSFKTVFKILMEESTLGNINISNFCSNFLTLYNEYGYTNVERLATYVCRDLKLQQGMDNPNDGLVYLRDYVKIMNELGYTPEKYSKSLKKDHDIASMNHKILGDKAYAKSLVNKVKEQEYQLLQYKTKEYSIVSPTVAEDVIKEGESLSHCVASYVKDIAKGLCKIVFLRKTKRLDESCVTIEVRGNAIRQVRGSNNRNPTNEEKEFVLQWAEEKKLIPNF